MIRNSKHLGNISHEFMLITPIGEDSIAICTECDYRANMEAAECMIHNERNDASQELVLVHATNIHTIEDVCAFLHCDEKSCMKNFRTKVLKSFMMTAGLVPESCSRMLSLKLFREIRVYLPMFP